VLIANSSYVASICGNYCHYYAVLLFIAYIFTESADNMYAVMHNPRSKDKGESAKGSEQEDIYIVMHPHPAFVPLIKKYFKKSK
jgi:hypothetical protein